MPDEKEPRYDVLIACVGYKLNEGREREQVKAKLELDFLDLSYVDFVAAQQKIKEIPGLFGPLGVAKVKSMGKGKKLEELGIGVE